MSKLILASLSRGRICGSLYMQLVCRHTLPLAGKACNNKRMHCDASSVSCHAQGRMAAVKLHKQAKTMLKTVNSAHFVVDILLRAGGRLIRTRLCHFAHKVALQNML